MNNFNQNKDLTQVFDERWKANYRKNEEVSQAKKDFNRRMFGMKDKEDVRKEMREYNSVASQVDRLNQRMKFNMSSGNNVRSGSSINGIKGKF